MTPGVVDLKIVAQKLRPVAANVADLRALPQSDLAELAADRRNPLAADAALRRALEAAAEELRLAAARLARPHSR